MALAAAIAAYPPLAAGRAVDTFAIAGAAAAIALLAGIVFRDPVFVVGGLALLAGQYAAYLLAYAEEIDAAAPFYAAALVVLGEIAFAAVEPQAVRDDAALLLRRVATVALVAVAAAAVGVVLLVTSAVTAGSAVLLEAVGVAAAIAVVGAAVRLAWRLGPRD